jgi:hypothetical protein
VRDQGEHADRRRARDGARDPQEHVLRRLEDRQQRVLPGCADEGDADRQAEDHDRRDDGVGEREERVRRQVEPDEVELALRLGEARAEEGRRLPRRERQGDADHRGERDRPEGEDEAAAAQRERFRLGVRQAPEPGAQRHQDVGQHRHLQQADEDLPDDAERGGKLAEEDAGRGAEREADEDLYSKARATPAPACVRRIHAVAKVLPAAVVRG